MGQFYRRIGFSNIPSPTEAVPMHTALIDEMTSLLKSLATLIRDCGRINQMVFKLSTNCLTLQDIRDALPDCIVAFEESNLIKSLPRTKPAAYNLMGEPMAYKQYERVLVDMEYYAALHVLV